MSLTLRSMSASIRMASRLRSGQFMANRIHTLFHPNPSKLTPVPRHFTYRSFTRSRSLRNEVFKLKDIENPEKLPSAPSSPLNPPPPPKTSRLAILRRVPWKTVIAIGLGWYVYRIADEAMRESVQAILSQFTVQENTWLYLNLNDLHVTESPHSERALQILPFVSSAGKRRMTVLEMTTTIAQAASDPRVKGLILAFNESMIEHRAILTGEVIESHLGMGVLNELQNAIGTFRMAKRMQRMQQKKEGEHVEPQFEGVEYAVSVASQEQGEGKERTTVDKYHPSQDVVIAVADNYSSGFDYALAAAASRIFIQPSGNVQLTGMSMQQLFFGNILKKYGVDFMVEARREYKSALASLTESAWNEPTRQNLEDLLWSLQTQTLFDIHYRGIPLDHRLPKHLGPPTFDPIAEPQLYAINLMQQSIRDAQKEPRNHLKGVMDILNQGPYSVSEALQLGLVDGIGYHQELLAEFREIGIKTWSLRKYCDAAIVQTIFSDIDMSKSIIPQLLRNKDKAKKKEEAKQGKVAKKDLRIEVSLVTEKANPTLDDAGLKVEIVVPRNVGLIFLDTEITGKGKFGGEATAAYILKAAKDPSIHSIVLRVNSPGGDAVASDTIWRAVIAARSAKPVIASLGDVAASGGYYIASGADSIFTNVNTITGSIGVIAGWPVIQRLLEKVDITSDQIKTLPNAAWRHMELGLPESEMNKLRKHIDETYDVFKHVVGLGRKMPVEKVEDIAQGQVFTGSQALQLGLVDKIGGLFEALMWAGISSIEKENLKEMAKLRAMMDDEMGAMLDDILAKGETIQNLIMEALTASPIYGTTKPTEEQIRNIMNRMNVAVRPQLATVIVPHVNLANEAFGVALAAAFQSDDERSPIQVDQPLIDHDDDQGDDGEGGANTQSRILTGALLGLARTNGIPFWQFPAFCYWFAAQAAGRVEHGGMFNKLFDGWFGKLLRDQNVFKSTSQRRSLFSGKGASWDIRMEMPPLEIYF